MSSDAEEDASAPRIQVAAQALAEYLRGIGEEAVLWDEDDFSDLPEKAQALLLALLDSVVRKVDPQGGGFSPEEKAILSSIQEDLGLATRDQVNHCRAASPGGVGCVKTPRVPLLKNLGVCSVHKYWQILSAWMVPGKLLVDAVDCCNCLGGEQVEKDKLTCMGCGKGVHQECLEAWVAALDPSNLPEDFQVKDVDYWTCSSCLATDWPRVSLAGMWLRGEDSERCFLLMPHEALVTGREELCGTAYQKAIEQSDAGELAPGFLVLKAKERPSRTGGQSFSLFSKRTSGSGQISLAGRGKEKVPAGASQGRADWPEQEEESSAVEAPGAAPESNLQAEIRRAVQQEMRAHGGQGAGRLAFPGTKRGLFTNVGSMVDGSQWGVKSGHEGAMNDANSAMREPYTGQGSSMGKHWGRVVEHLIGQSSVSVRLNGFMPGSAVRAQQFTVSEEGHLMVADSGSLAVPPQATWLRWVDARIRAWKAVGDSEIGVYNPSHEDFLFFTTMANVVIMRYKWLRAVAADLQAGYDCHPWSVVWRYLVLTVQREFMGQPGFSSRLDRQLLEIQEEDAFDQEQALAGLMNYDFYRMQLAEREAGLQVGGQGGVGQLDGDAGQAGGRGGNGGQRVQSQLLPQPLAPQAPQAPPRAPAAAPARPPRRQKPCPLCGSQEHTYYAGHYTHLAGMPITKPCSMRLSDDTTCGRLHAYAGPLASPAAPCRQVGEQQ